MKIGGIDIIKVRIELGWRILSSGSEIRNYQKSKELPYIFFNIDSVSHVTIVANRNKLLAYVLW